MTLSTTTVVLGLMAATAGLLLFTPLGDRPMAALLPTGTVAPVDFATLQPAATPNRFLACPAGLCAASDMASPEFDLPVEDLRRRWQAVVAAMPRVARIGEQGEWQADFVQRSARLRFPDIVTVRFVALGPQRSTLAVYSRSVYGRSDLGVNRARVVRWLAALKDR